MRLYLGPGGRRGIWRFSFRSWDHDWSPEAVWEPEDSSIGPETVLGTLRFLRSWLDPEEPGGSSLDPEIFAWNQEVIWEPGEPKIFIFVGTVLRLPRQDYYRYLFGFRILPLESWPLSSSYGVFYFCRKSLTCLKGAGVGVMTQVPGFAAFHFWIIRDYETLGSCSPHLNYLIGSFPPRASGSCSGFGFLPPASSVLPPALVLGSLLEKYSGIEFLQIPGRTPASGSPLGDAPGPRWKVLRVRSQGPPPSSRKWKYSDKGILPYF
ncbi:hypothetical protein F2Q68_00016396 [Brassica cretica]|uniref:Uncharacterized protein n=1 Tax=Brassica cretica TaxID=69181 RepID=A0A8S9HLI1_BRACR|nr:hypothetical protein F2Q68_00016396 [Brassica cretica]